MLIPPKTWESTLQQVLQWIFEIHTYKQGLGTLVLGRREKGSCEGMATVELLARAENFGVEPPTGSKRRF